MSGDSGISAFPEEDNIFFWKGTITGSKDTVFEGTEYKLSLSFPNDYPFKPPKVKFETACFHPNVDVHGNICLDILQVNWSDVMWHFEMNTKYYNCVLELPLYSDDVFFFFSLCRINGHLLMMLEQFLYPSKVCLEVTWKISWCLSYFFDYFFYLLFLSNVEPNISSPLNPQAAQLWSNQEGEENIDIY